MEQIQYLWPCLLKMKRQGPKRHVSRPRRESGPRGVCPSPSPAHATLSPIKALGAAPPWHRLPSAAPLFCEAHSCTEGIKAMVRCQLSLPTGNRPGSGSPAAGVELRLTEPASAHMPRVVHTPLPSRLNPPETRAWQWGTLHWVSPCSLSGPVSVCPAKLH